MKGKKPVIVTFGNPDRGVIFAWVDEIPEPGDSPTLYGARMVLYWSRECRGLFGLAANGPQTDTRLSPAVTTSPGPVARVIHVPTEIGDKFDRWKR